jgi:hypothetical protein
MTPQTKALLLVKLRIRGWKVHELQTAVFTENAFDGHAHGIRVTTQGGGKRVMFYHDTAVERRREKVTK